MRQCRERHRPVRHPAAFPAQPPVEYPTSARGNIDPACPPSPGPCCPRRRTARTRTARFYIWRSRPADPRDAMRDSARRSAAPLSRQ
jgi:hypothetical protein